MNRQYQTNTIKDHVFQLLNALNKSKPNIIWVSLLLIIVFQFTRLSVIFPTTFETGTYSLLEEIFFQVIYYSNLTNLLKYVGLSNSTIVIIYVLTFYIIGVFYFIFSLKYRNMNDSLYLRYFLVFSSSLYEICYWVLMVPAYQAFFAEIINGSNIVTQVFAGIGLPSLMGMVVAFNYCEFDIVFLGKEYIHSKFSKVQIYIALGNILVTLIEEITVVAKAESAKPYFLTILALFELYYFYNYFPICNRRANKFYFVLSFTIIYLIWPIYARIYMKDIFDCSFVCIVGGILFAAIGQRIHHWRKWNILFELDYMELDPLLMDWACRKIISYLKSRPSKKTKASLKIVLFLKSHIKRCQFSDCPCKTIDFEHLYSDKGGKLFEKTIFTLTLKAPIIKMLSHSFRKKVASMHRDKNIDFAINYTSFLFCHTEEYMVGFSDLTTVLVTRRNLKMSQLFRIHTIQSDLEELLNKSASVTNDSGSNFNNVIIFYKILAELRKKMSESLDKYIKFYDELKKSEIQMNVIVKHGGEIRTQQDMIRDFIDQLYHLNKDNNQLTRLVYLYASLGIILEDKSKKISNLFRDAGQFIQRIKKADNFPDVFDEECSVVFIALTENKLGVIRKASPYIKTMFGYDFDSNDVLHVEQLMPRAFGEKHDMFLKEFLRKSDYRRLNKYIDVFGQTREGYLMAIDLYLKLEVVAGELLVAGFMKTKNSALNYLLCNEQGILTAYSHKMHNILGLDGESNKDMYGLPIALLAPRLILFYLFQGEQVQNVFIKVVLGLLDNNNDDIEEGKEVPESEEMLLANERLYFCVPTNKDLLSQYVSKFKNLMSPQNLAVKKRFDIEREFLSILVDAYSTLSHDSIRLYKFNCHFKKNMQRGDVVKINFLEVMKVEKIQGHDKAAKFLQLSKEFLENVSTYHLQYNPGQNSDPTIMFKFLYRDIIHELTPGTMINVDRIGDRTPDDMYSAYAEKSHVDPGISHDKILKDQMANKHLQKRKVRALAYLMKQGLLKKEMIVSMGPSNGTNELTVRQESENPNMSHNYSESEAQYDSGQLNNKIVAYETEAIQNIVKQDSIPGSQDFDINTYKRPETRSITMMKAIGTLYHEVESNKDNNSESNAFGREDDDVTSSEKKRKRRVVFDTKVNEKLYQVDDKDDPIQGNEKQSARSSQKTTSSATSKLFKTLLLDSRPPAVVETIQIYGFVPLLMMLSLSAALYLVTQSRISDYRAFSLHADFASDLLVSYSFFEKQIESLMLVKDVLSSNSYLSASSIDLLIQNAIKFENRSYYRYKDDLSDSVINFRLQEITDKFSLDNYIFKMSQLDSNNQKILYDISSGHMMVHAAGIMNKILNMDYLNYDQYNSDIYFIRTNLEVYAKGLTQISNDLQNIIISDTTSNSSKWTFFQLMIIHISVVVLLMVSLMQVYNNIVKVKDKGLSLLITINKTIIDEKTFDCQAVQKSIQNDHMDLDTAYKTINFKAKADGKSVSYRVGKNVSHTSNEFIIFFMLSGIAGGAFIGYFIGCLYISVNAINALGPILREYRTVSNIKSFYATEYAILGQSLNLWNDSTIDKTTYPTKFTDFKKAGASTKSDLLNFISQLENYFEGNDYVSSDYKTTLLALKYNDVCDFLTNSSQTPTCQNALQRISRVGLTPTLSKVLDLIETYYLNAEDLGFSFNATVQALSDTNFMDLDSYLDYGEDIIGHYMTAVKGNISTQLDELDSKLLSFTIVGCIIVALVFLIGWQIFVHKLKRDILVVKRTFSVLPLDLILTNNFIKKFLKDNSKNA